MVFPAFWRKILLNTEDYKTPYQLQNTQFTQKLNFSVWSRKASSWLSTARRLFYRYAAIQCSAHKHGRGSGDENIFPDTISYTGQEMLALGTRLFPESRQGFRHFQSFILYGRQARAFFINDEKGPIYWGKNRKSSFTTESSKGPTGVNSPVVITLKNALPQRQ